MRFRTLTLTSLLALASTASNAFADACQATYSYTGAIVDCTVLTTDSYSITAYGAQGGTGLAGAGGLGAEVAEDITINAGDVLEILAGGMGATGNRGGGGGGTFVYDITTSMLLLAAGGGGFSGNGANGSENAKGGFSFLNGGAGGIGTGAGQGGSGGFGGGGAGGQSDGGGGGGGYSGGGGGAPGNGGGGGGSFVSGALTQLIGAENAGNGLVYIAEGTSIQLPGSGSTTVPEPASLAIFGVSLIGLGAIRRRFQAR
jgi:hypothetical protein